MTVPTLIVEIGFTAPTTGTVLHIGDRVRGIIGTNTIAGADLLTDVSEYVTAVNVRRGATRADGPVLRYEAGTCTITLRNDDRRFDPTNLGGPYVLSGRSQVEPMRAVRVRATLDGHTWALFRGFTDDWSVQYDGPNSSYVTVTCFDAFGVFASYDRGESAPAGAGEDSGARIHRILDSITWSDEDRMIDTGDEALQSTTLANNTLSELLLTADSELGHLFMDAQGRVRFRRRLADQEEPESLYANATFGDEPEDGDTTINLATNPSLETDTAGGWVAIGSVPPTLAQDNTRAAFGSWSLKATWGTGGFLPGVTYDVTGLIAGETYTISVYVYVPSGSPHIDTIVAGRNTFGSGTTMFDQWERLFWTGTADPDGELAFAFWPRSSPTAGQMVWIDGLQAEEGITVTDYVDGDQAGCEWDGVAHASTSRRLPELPCADAPLTSDKQSIANLISIANAGGTAQEAEDSGSRSAYLTRTYQRTDLLMQSDAEALLYAHQILGRASSPELRFPLVELKPTRDARLWAAALGRRFGDRIRVRRRPPGGGDMVERECHVRGVEHETDAQQRWVTRLVLQAAPTITAITDTFTRTVASGWGTTDSGHVWTVSGGATSDYSATGTRGRHTHNATNTLHHSLIDVGSPNAEVLADVTIAVGTPSGGPITCWVVGRAADTSNYYYTRLDIAQTTAAATLILAKRVVGVTAGLISAVSVGTHTAGATWRIRFRCIGSRLQAKAWKTTDVEPASWQADTTDTSLTAGTNVGVLSRFESGNTNTLPQNIDWDNVSATSLHAWT